MQYFSSEYFETLSQRLNADADWRKKAATTTAKVILTVTDRATSFLLDVTNGLVSARKAAVDDPADFKFEATYEVWLRVARGETDFNTAVLTGKMRFKGSLPKIMGLQPQMTRLAEVAKHLEALP